MVLFIQHFGLRAREYQSSDPLLSSTAPVFTGANTGSINRCTFQIFHGNVKIVLMKGIRSVELLSTAMRTIHFEVIFVNYVQFLRWPKSVTATSILLKPISICSRQLQFTHGNFNFVHGNFNFTHDNFNWFTTISIYSRQFQFTHGNFNFTHGNAHGIFRFAHHLSATAANKRKIKSRY